MGLLDAKKNLTFKEVGQYLHSKGYEKLDDNDLYVLIKDLFYESKINISLHHRGDFLLEDTETIYIKKDVTTKDGKKNQVSKLVSREVNSSRDAWLSTYIDITYHDSVYTLFESYEKFKSGISILELDEGKIPFFLKNSQKETIVEKLDEERQLHRSESRYLDDPELLISYENIRFKREDFDKLLYSPDIHNEIKEKNALIKELQQQLKQISQPKVDEGQGNTLLILGAVMNCIKHVARQNYTQQLLIDEILSKYRNTPGISDSTLKKKFPEAKKQLNQRVTT